ncbi:MAG: YibE/F family protein [Acidimicrobiales bacterium]
MTSDPHHARSPVDSPAPARTRSLLVALAAPFLLATVVGLAVLWPGGAATGPDPSLGAPDDLVDGRVVDVRRGPCPGADPSADLTCVVPQVRVLEGPDRGEVVSLGEQTEGRGSARFEVGDTLVLSYFPEAEEGFRYSFADRERRVPLLVLGGLFASAVVALGRWRGLRALLGLPVSLGVVIVFVLPAILEGSSPLLVALVGASVVAFTALYLAHGVNARTTTAVIGTLASLALVGALGAAFVAAAQLSGLADEDATFLQVAAAQINFQGLLLGGIVIGALGVLDDVTVTQASAVWELRRANPGYRRRDLYRAGIRIGQDHIASTVNTLVLAYAGASLPLFLLFTQAGQGLGDVVNGEAIAVEVVRALVGSLGLVASVPLTTALATWAVASTPPTGATDRSSRSRRHPGPTPARRRRGRSRPAPPAG